MTKKALALKPSVRGEAMDILQTLSNQEQDDILLAKHLELRYGHTHFEQLYRSQISIGTTCCPGIFDWISGP